MIEFKLTPSQKETVEQYLEAKRIFALVEKKYKNDVSDAFLEFARNLNIGSFVATTDVGVSLQYVAPREYYTYAENITVEHLVYKQPDAFVKKVGYEAVKIKKA